VYGDSILHGENSRQQEQPRLDTPPHIYGSGGNVQNIAGLEEIVSSSSRPVSKFEKLERLDLEDGRWRMAGLYTCDLRDCEERERGMGRGMNAVEYGFVIR
jgi:hypothetical protein